MTLLLLIAVGGALGALVHYHVTAAVSDPDRVVMLTLITCGVLGFFTAAAPPDRLVGVAGFGFLAALAPMSSVALVFVTQVRARRYRRAVVVLAATVIGGIACAMLGFLLYSSGLTLYRKF
ncbi:CrcB family protein [Rhodococcoides fascians]|uniref:CrcB family protein n=1 Tax=Rhodococcoides fascians TaxID=1828 RepID=UPI00056CFD8D|nr:CrcB family protein [Rhodococcus fascians]